MPFLSSVGQERRWGEKLTGQDKGHLLNKIKDQKQKKAKSIFFSTSHQQVISIHRLGTMVLVRAVVGLGDKCLNNEWFPPLPPSFFCSFYCWAKIWHGIFLWPVWISCPDCVPSQPLAFHVTRPGSQWWLDCHDAVGSLLSSNQSISVLFSSGWDGPWSESAFLTVDCKVED